VPQAHPRGRIRNGLPYAQSSARQPILACAGPCVRRVACSRRVAHSCGVALTAACAGGLQEDGADVAIKQVAPMDELDAAALQRVFRDEDYNRVCEDCDDVL
jgi:hypothetical protein